MAPHPSPPQLPERDTGDTTFQGHDSADIANALASHSQKMADLAKELSDQSTSTYEGHDSSDIANAIQNYVVHHQSEPWKQNFAQPAVTDTPKLSQIHMGSVLAAASNSDINIMPGPAFSLSGLVHGHYWMSVLLCIVWIVTGLFLLFFGWAAYFWGIHLGTGWKRIDKKAKRTRRLAPMFAGAPLAGGVGGVVIGFLFFSFLATVVTSAICVSKGTTVSSTSYFAIWLVPGAFGAFLAGHWPLLARAFTGLLSGACMTLIMTAMFGVHTLIIRAIFIAVCTSVITAPLLLPKSNAIHFHLLNFCTSVIGMVSFLDGVALFAPARASGDSWIDLWVVLFALDGSAAESSASKKWGSSAFKGLIAGAVIGTLAGYAFELFFHKHAAEDPDMEWNNYLGSFTHRLNNLEGSSPIDRAGSFHPAPTTWQRIAGVFAAPGSPAVYGNVSNARDGEKSPLTDLPGRKTRNQARRARTAKVRGGPAKFSSLNKNGRDLELAESDSDDETEYDSDSSLHRLNARSKAVSVRSNLTKADVDELADELRPLSASGDSGLDKDGRPQILRPPSYRTNTTVSRSGSTGSGLSGTTAQSASVPSRLSSKSNPAENSVDVYKEGDALSSPTEPSFSRQRTTSPPPSSPTTNLQVASPLSSLGPNIPATPSLVNAITRIQAAQAQARAWYETQALSPLSKISQEPDAETLLAKNADDDDESAHATSQPADAESSPFQSWWGKEVKGATKPSK